MHHKALNSPGMWFVAPYKGLREEEADRSWVGPCIYNGNGELIWSGGTAFSSNVEDFRINNVNGEDVMTMITHAGVYVLNDDYTIRSAIDLTNGGYFNTHEMNFVDNGTRAIIVKHFHQRASEEESRRIGFDGECRAQFDGFAVLDVTKGTKWPQIFEWSSFGKIGLEEGTMTKGTLDKRCEGWDLVHANSVEKTPEGDYLFSARHTDTVYKISGKDGSIVWRLGGVKSSFNVPEDLVFSRQHDVRYQGRNETHTFLSILDNAKGQDDKLPSHDWSRGLLIAIDEENMMASLEQEYIHPNRHHPGLPAWAPRRGNFQMLPNGNVLMGWSERAMQSEHTANGRLVWEAALQVDWMGSYRNYKFDGLVGKPREPPVAVARSHDKDDNRGKMMTTVHVSWNGATEVGSWDLYRTSPDGETVKVRVDSKAKRGFETALFYHGYASNFVVEAFNGRGEVVGRTPVIRTVADFSVAGEAITALAAEQQWLEGFKEARGDAPAGSMATFFVVGMIIAIAILVLCWQMKRRGLDLLWQYYHQCQRYAQLPQQDEGLLKDEGVLRQC